MTKRELLEVIINFQDAIKEKRLPDFNNNRHRAEQVLRILKVDYHSFAENEERRACDPDIRGLWEKEFSNSDRADAPAE